MFLKPAGLAGGFFIFVSFVHFAVKIFRK